MSQLVILIFELIVSRLLYFHRKLFIDMIKKFNIQELSINKQHLREVADP